MEKSLSSFPKLAFLISAGLDVIHAMTSSATYELKAKIDAYDGNKYYAVYSGFSVDSPTADYCSSLPSFQGRQCRSVLFYFYFLTFVVGVGWWGGGWRVVGCVCVCVFSVSVCVCVCGGGGVHSSTGLLIYLRER